MPIKNPKAYANSWWDWSILAGCFGDTKIMPTDIDGMVERRGQLLLMETKDPGVPIKKAQFQTFLTFIQHPNQTVFLIWGPRNNPQVIRVLTCERSSTYYHATIDTLRGLCKDWFDHANRNGRGQWARRR